MFKKIVIISSIILSGLALIASIYFLFFRKPESAFQLPSEPVTVEMPTIIADNLVFVSRTPYIGATLGPDGRKIRYFDSNSKSFMESEFSGLNPTRLTETDFKEVPKIIWSPDKSKIIAVFNDETGKRHQLINLSTDEKILYPKEYQSLVFSPTSNEIAFNFYEPEKGINKIEISDLTGKNRRDVSKVRIQDLVLFWPRNNQLGIASLSSALNSSALFLLDITKNDLRKITPEVNGLEILWSPDGNKTIYSYIDENNKELKLMAVDVLTGKNKDLGISTFASKCAWSADSRHIFCAVPFEWPNIKLTLPDDYWQKTFFTFDHIIRINFENKQKEVVFSAEINAPDVSDIFLDPREEYLFFTNKKDGLFYTIKL